MTSFHLNSILAECRPFLTKITDLTREASEVRPSPQQAHSTEVVWGCVVCGVWCVV